MQDWERVGLEAPSGDPGEIKRAYARRVKVVRPDEDAAAYQALREAYDRLMDRARAGLPPAAPAAPAVPAVPAADADADADAEMQRVTPASAASEGGARAAPPRAAVTVPQAWRSDAHVEEIRSAARTPIELARWLDEACRERGQALVDLEAALPRELALMPFENRQEASIRLADVVLAHAELMPPTVLAMLQRHFAWLEEYRSVRELGHDRAEALQPLIAHLADPVTDPEVLKDYAEAIAVKRIFDSERDLRTFFIFVLMGEFWRRRAESLDAGILRRLQIKIGEGMRMEGWADLAGIVRAMLAWGVMLGFCVAAKSEWRGGATAAVYVGVYAALLWGFTLAILMMLRQWRQAGLASQALRAMPSLHDAIARSPFGRLGPDALWPMLGVFLLLLAAEILLWSSGSKGLAATAFGLMVLGFGMAAPRRLNPGVTAVGLGLVGHYGAQLPASATALLMAWILGGMQVYLKRGYRPDDGSPPEVRVGLPIGLPRGGIGERALLFTLGLPSLVAWIADRAGDRLVLTALVFAGTPMLAGIDMPRGTPVAILAVSLIVLLALQRWGLRLGRRMLGIAPAG